MRQKRSSLLRYSICFLLCILFVFTLFTPAYGADSFETSIAAFPESYRVLLRELHAAHPTWEFKAMKTGLDWDKAVSAEQANNNSLVPASTSYANIFKSKAIGDYNYSSNYYIQKDGGFVNANKYAVSFFMDPRNFLNEENIFQFEDLSFDKSFDDNAVEVILSGTFMYKKKISYLNKNGETVSTDETYAEVIYLAGKTYNVNPCYLASKIRSEIGSTPSGSVSGRNGSYPGIYNFYNIGATDGSGAITRGLAYAAGSGSYGRPWNSPRKSILGGAQFIADTYIAKGQHTGYLQRFNVNPKSNYPIYNHQYMTNVVGATVQGYTNYRSYLSIGLLNNRFVFSIPIYENMTGAKDNTGTLTLADAADQKAVMSLTVNTNVRSGPSVNHDTIGVQLSPGDTVTVLDEQKTDSRYYDSILRYPNWYYVKFAKNGQTYKGWVSAGFFTLKTTKTVGLGTYTPVTASTNSNLKFKYVSMDARYATIENETKIKFLAEGTVNILAYDSTGRYAVVRYVVSKDVQNINVVPPGNFSVSNTSASGFKLHWSAVSGVSGYRVYLFDTAKGSFQPYATTTKTAYTFTGLRAGTIYQIKLKSYKKSGSKTLWSEASGLLRTATTPPAPKTIKQSDSFSNSLSMKWSAVSNASYYELYQYMNGAYKKVLHCHTNRTSVSALSPATAYQFKVCAVISVDGTVYRSAQSAAFTARTGPATVQTVAQSSTSSVKYTLTWSSVPGADGYKVYRMNNQTYRYELLGVTKNKKTKYAIKNLSPGQVDVYAVKPYQKLNGSTYYGSLSEEFLAVTAPAKVKGLKQTGATNVLVTLAWTAAENASGYGVFQKQTDGSFKKIATVASNSARISMPAKSSANYRVRAFIRSGEAVFWGAYSNEITARVNQ